MLQQQEKGNEITLRLDLRGNVIVYARGFEEKEKATRKARRNSRRKANYYI